ncbi:MAG TPA: O-antigen ligase family protein [Chloroflexota bacterium]|nr:O-antigen ligase family protein [Chloroflexota bacterium]
MTLSTTAADGADGLTRPRTRNVLLAVGALTGCIILILSLSPWPQWVDLSFAAVAALLLTFRWPVIGFALLAFSVPWGSDLALTVGAFPITSTDYLVAAVGAAWLVSAAGERRNPIVRTPWLPYIAIFLAALILASLTALDVHLALKEDVKWLELAVVYLAGVYLLDRRDVGIVVATVVGAAVSQAFLGYAQVLSQAGPQSFVISSGLLRAYGSFDQPNPYAGYLNLVWPLALVFAVMKLPGKRLYGISVVLIALAILVSASRGAFLAALVALAVMAAMVSISYRKLIWTGILVGVAGALFANYGAVPLGPFQKLLALAGLGSVSFTSVNNANYSAVERAAHWLAGVRMFSAYPVLGVGPGNYSVAYPRFHPRGWYASLEHAHDYYINIAAEAGIIGLAAYVLFAGSALWYCYAASCRAPDTQSRAVSLGVLGALAATSFHNLFDVLYVHGLVALLGLLMAIVAVGLRPVRGPFDEYSVGDRIRGS